MIAGAAWAAWDCWATMVTTMDPHAIADAFTQLTLATLRAQIREDDAGGGRNPELVAVHFYASHGVTDGLDMELIRDAVAAALTDCDELADLCELASYSVRLADVELLGNTMWLAGELRALHSDGVAPWQAPCS